jgi:hypothetical protein
VGKSKASYARAVGRVLGRYSQRNRYVRGGMSAADTTLRTTARVGRILWLQVFGLLCVVFCLSLAGVLWQQGQRWATLDQGARLRVEGGAAVLAIFCWFAVSSFWRARRMKRT